jgi:urease accessory protein
MATPWLIWQLIDSAFPSGSFTHSGGLEAAWQQGVVSDGESLETFLKTSLRQLQHGVMTFVRQTWIDPQRFDDIDRECDLFLNNHIANRASRAQGKALLSSAGKTFAADTIGALSQRVRVEQLPAHLPVVFGAIQRCLKIDCETTLSMFAFLALRGQISVAVRLGIVGPFEGQRIQSQLSTDHRPLTTDHYPVQISPVLDLLQAGHDRLYSRLFQS